MRSIKDLPWEWEKDGGRNNPVEVSQIKQKFGGLRIYHYNASEDIRQLIDHAIEASWHTCERCGATEGVTTNLESYRLTLCQKCRKEIKPRTTIRKRIELHRQK